MVASAAEAELGALYHNCQTGIIFCQRLEAMGHKQSKTPVHCNNTTTVCTANNAVKQHRLQSMEMRFFWISDKVAQECTHSDGTQDKNIWRITKASIIQVHII